MKIAHLVQSLNPDIGGLPVVPARLAAAQARLGHEVLLLAERDAPEDLPTPRLLRETPGGDQVRHHALTPANLASLLGLGPARADLDQILRNCQIVHLHGIWEPIAFAAGQSARRLGIPYLIAPHGMLDPWCLAQKAWKKRLALALGWRGLLNRAAALHVLNADEAELLRPLGLSPRLEVIPNGIFLEEIPTPIDPEEFIGSVPGLAGHPYILFLSRLHYKKGLDHLAEAFARLAPEHPGTRLVVAGPDEGARSDFEAALRGHGLSGRVHVVGPLAGRRKWAALAGAHVFCLPSRQEGFSMAILEAMASGRPVVISDACHFPEVAEVHAGAIVPLNPAAIAQALSELCADDAKAQRQGQAGRALIEQRFTWTRAAERSLEVYEQLRATT